MKLLWRWHCPGCNRQFWTNSADDDPARCPWCGAYRNELERMQFIDPTDEITEAMRR
jgi:rubrerythrin